MIKNLKLKELGDCETVEQVEKFIETNFPKGLDHELCRRNDGGMFNDGVYIGFKLSRYLYRNQLAAYAHAMRDIRRGITYESYWTEFQPNVKDATTDDEGVTTWEGWTKH